MRELTAEQVKKRNEWINKARLLGMQIEQNQVTDVPPAITSLVAPDGISLSPTAFYNKHQFSHISVSIEDVSLEDMWKSLSRSKTTAIAVLEIRDYQDGETLISYDEIRFLPKLLELGGIRRLVIGAGVFVDGTYVDKKVLSNVKNQTCEVVFKRIFGNMPKKAGERVICTGTWGKYAEELAAALNSRKRVIEMESSVIINMRAGHEVDVDECLKRAKVDASNRNVVAAVARGYNRNEPTTIKSHIPLHGIVVGSECVTTLHIDSDAQIGTLMCYGAIDGVSGTGYIRDLILTKRKKPLKTVIYGKDSNFIHISGINIGHLRFAPELKNRKSYIFLEIVSNESSMMKINEITGLDHVHIKGDAQIHAITNTSLIEHKGGTLKVVYAELGSCKGIGRDTSVSQVKFLAHLANFYQHSFYGEGFQSDTIAMEMGKSINRISLKKSVYANRLVVDGHVVSNDFIREALNVKEVYINGQVVKP